MSESCNQDCNSCSQDCEERKIDFSAKLNEHSKVKKVIGVVSGKGGVGKSLVTSLLSIYMNKRGYRTAVLDADITGPSIPKVFGISEKATGNQYGVLPAISKTGIQVMSLNLLLENDTDPVVWRGPVIANTVKQFWTDVIWDDVDYMFVDMPPGTGDVPLTVFQSLPIDGVVIVTSPQDLVSLIVTKSIKMANMMNIPVLGIVENMSYAVCPGCNEKIEIFGESKIEKVSQENNIEIYDRVPINPEITKLSDQGFLEAIEESYLENIVNKVESLSK